MQPEVYGADDFLASAMVSQSPLTPDAGAFLKEREVSASYDVERVPLASLPNWHLGDRLNRADGRFFTVEGLSVRTDFGPVPHWSQPIIVQPEIGILGILAKRIDGVLHFLMQAKMEPGNTTFVQYAATVQATPSNYQRVHGGRATPYLDYFLQGRRGRRILFDQLLSEHGFWYLYKRNRNMIVEVPEDEDVPVHSDFTWLTLGQLRQQLAQGNGVNMNARTVLSGIAYGGAALDRLAARPDGFHAELVTSHQALRSDDDLAGALTWLIDQKATYSLDVRRTSLREMDEWIVDDDSVRHRDDGRYFEINGVSVQATSREVGAWSQAMLEPAPGNTVALICQRRAGVLQFLVQATVQPGLTDRLELGPTVQFAPGYHRGPQDIPPLAQYLDAPASWNRLKAIQSEDGGRFAKADTLHQVIELPEDHTLEAPANYRWMTLGLLNRMTRFGYHVNVEARSLAACLL
ncbi:NDP-hexose 2,3-dehydratase family protein [Streptomyces sp. NPDC004520]|uniref:NDP-hexose 2,3-dehydratase family protein n=1 Tax=Streptomyces sp. NPDC004520 TaxID=3364702 RepID=UPI0036AEDC28